MTQPTPPPESDPNVPADAPEPASSWVQDHEPATTEAERQAHETVRSVSRLEESN